MRSGRNFWVGWACLLAISLACSGCASWRWSYVPDPPANRAPLLANTVAVPPFTDERPSELYDHTALMLIPLVLYYSVYADKVEERLPEKTSQFNPLEDIPKALAVELQNRRFFKSAFFAQSDREGELVLRGKLTSTKFEETGYSYGVSLFLVYFYALGLPMATGWNELIFSLQLEEPQSHTVLWHKTYTAKDSGTRGAWYGPRNSLWYDAMLKKLMPTILSDLEAAMSAMASPGGGTTKRP